MHPVLTARCQQWARAMCVVRRVPVSWQPPSKCLPSYLLCAVLPDRPPAPLLQISPDWLARLMPAVAQLDPDWLAKVIPAALKALDPDWVVRLVNAISPGLNKVNPDLIVGLLPLVNTISLDTWTKLIELLNMITIPQVKHRQRPAVCPRRTQQLRAAGPPQHPAFRLPPLPAQPLRCCRQPPHCICMPPRQTPTCRLLAVRLCLCVRLCLQLEFLLHLLDVTGPVLDKMVNLLNTMRRMLPVDKTNYMGKVTLFTKPKGTIGMQPSSIILGRKIHPQSPPNNGAPPAPTPPPIDVPPRTLNRAGSSNTTTSAFATTGRRLQSFWHLLF